MYPLERCIVLCIVALWICILTVSLPLYSVHWVVLYRCVSYRCVVMYRFLCLVPSFAQYSNLYQYMRLYRLSSILNDTNRYMTSLSPLPRGCFGPGETCIDTGSNRGAPSVRITTAATIHKDTRIRKCAGVCLMYRIHTHTLVRGNT